MVQLQPVTGEKLTAAERQFLRRFGKVVAQVREKQGLSQADLGERASKPGHKIDKRRIQSVEMGEHNTSLAVIVRIVEALEIRLSLPDLRLLSESGETKAGDEALHQKLQDVMDAGGDPARWIEGNILTFHEAYCRKRSGQ